MFHRKRKKTFVFVNSCYAFCKRVRVLPCLIFFIKFCITIFFVLFYFCRLSLTRILWLLRFVYGFCVLCEMCNVSILFVFYIPHNKLFIYEDRLEKKKYCISNVCASALCLDGFLIAPLVIMIRKGWKKKKMDTYILFGMEIFFAKERERKGCIKILKEVVHFIAWVTCVLRRGKIKSDKSQE